MTLPVKRIYNAAAGFLDQYQILRYIIVGCINFTIFNLIFNSLLVITKALDPEFAFKGKLIYPFVFIGFMAAVTNSYFMHRAWTFKAKGQRKYKFFVFVSVIGLAINESIAGVLINFVGSPGALVLILENLQSISFVRNAALSAGSVQNLCNLVWATGSAVVAVLISTVWNFCAYKFLVFKKKDDRA
jgi:putative flippase GtrA